MKEKEKEKITLKKILNEFEIYIGTVVFLALTVLLTIQVVSRYVFKHSFTWTEEAAVVMFVWLIYLGVAAAVTKRKHLKIDALITVLPFKGKKALLILDNVICFGFCIGIVPPFTSIIRNQIEKNAVTSLLRWPKAVIYSIIPICMVLTCIRLVQDTIRLCKESEKELGQSKPTIDIEALEQQAAALKAKKEQEQKEQVKEAK